MLEVLTDSQTHRTRECQHEGHRDRPAGIGEPETLQVRTRELPEPGPGQVVVRVEATGISFAEQQMRRGKYYDQPPFPFVPGYDLVGVVEAPGPARPPVGRASPR